MKLSKTAMICFTGLLLNNVFAAPQVVNTSPVIADNTISGTNAGGESQTTIVDENGNLKVIDTNKAPQTTSSATQAPTQEQLTPSTQNNPPPSGMQMNQAVPSTIPGNQPVSPAAMPNQPVSPMIPSQPGAPAPQVPEPQPGAPTTPTTLPPPPSMQGGQPALPMNPSGIPNPPTNTNPAPSSSQMSNPSY